MFKLVLEKAEEPEIKLPTSSGSSKMQESSIKTSISALLTMSKPLTVRITILKNNLMIYFIIFNPTWSLYLCKLWRKGWNKIVYSVNYHTTTYWKFQSFLLYLHCLLHHLSSFHLGTHLLPGLLFCCIVHCSGAIKLKTDRKLIFLYFWANTTAYLFSWGL